MSLAVILLIIALVLFLVATFGAWGRINLVAAGLACWVAAVLLGAGHVVAATQPQLVAYLATVAPTNLPAIPYGWDAIAAVAAALSPLLLQRFPAQIKGKPMVLIAGAVAVACGLGGMLLQGQFAHFDPALTVTYLLALIGIASKFYDLFKDDLKLADPPVSVAPPLPTPPKVV